MTKVITFGIQKGGSSKTTSAGITAHLLSQEARVLCVDMDSQGNLTELLTGRDIYDYHGHTVLEAMKAKSTNGCVFPVSDTLHIIPADDHLATLPRWLYTEYRGNRSTLLSETLAPIIGNYDYVIIDTPPALGDQTVNALAVADAVVVMFETSKFCYSALSRFLETVDHAREMVNPKLKVAGILRNLIDVRRSDAKAYSEVVEEEYPNLVFQTTINRRATTGRISTAGFIDNDELDAAIVQYRDFVEELKMRV